MTGPADIEPEQDLTGRLLNGKYRVRRLLGKGGFGSVYEAEDETFGPLVAVKVLNPHAASHIGAIDQFLAEARVLTNLDDPNVVRWITFDKTEDGLHYFVMERLNGEELSDVLYREGPLNPRRVVEILMQILSALKAAHRLADGSSLLHLDLKPQNVFVVNSEPERVKVIDFGISQHVGAQARASRGVRTTVLDDERVDLGATLATVALVPTPPSEKTTAPLEEASSATTTRKKVVRARGGTPLYASPEQCKHLAGHHDIIALDQRSDLYSLGVIAFQMLTGELPYGYPPNPFECFKAHLESVPRKLGDFGVKAPRRLAAFVDRCLKKNREDRFASAEEAIEELERIRRPPSLWSKLSLAALAAVVVVMVSLWPDPRRFKVGEAGEDDVVYLGPKRTYIELPLSDLQIEGESATAIPVADPATRQRVLPGWHAEIRRLPTGLVAELRAPAGFDAPVDDSIYLSVEGASPDCSEELRVVFVGAGSWGIRRLFVKDLAEDEVLDPRDHDLLIELSGRLDYIADRGVKITCNRDPEPKFPKRSSVPSVDDKGAVFEVGFDKFSKVVEPWSDQATSKMVRFDLEVTDKAGGVQRQTREFAIDPRRLVVAARLLNCTPTGTDSYFVSAKMLPTLMFTSNRPIRSDFRVTARKNNGDPLVVKLRPAEGGAEQWILALPPPGPTDLGSYESTVSIAVEDVGIRHSRGAERAVTRFDVTYNSNRLEVGLELDGIEIPATATDASERHYTRRSFIDLGMVEQNTVRALVRLRVTAPSGSDLPLVEVELRENARDRVKVDLSTEGLHEIKLQAFRLTRDREIAEAPEWTRTLSVVRDSSPSVASVEGVSGFVLRKNNANNWAPVLSLRDTQTLVARAPVNLSWAITGPSTSEKGECLPGTFSLAGLGLDPAALADGEFVLTVTGKDLAGNAVVAFRGAAMEYRWVVARTGPSLEFGGGAETWVPQSGDVFLIAVTARDANGVASVTCGMEFLDGSGRVGPIDLQKEPNSDSKDARWIRKYRLPQEFSEKQVSLSFTATDSYGNRTTMGRQEMRVDAFRVTRLKSLNVRRRGDARMPWTKMHLVKEILGYDFGGRDAAKEQLAFTKFGAVMPPRYRPLSTARAIPKLPAYYLDETEVTNEQFMAFVRDGYQDPRYWEGMPRGYEKRKPSVVLQELARLGRKLPVTRVDFFEAAAYARWIGKRLPTIEEWERAVRGGHEYRPISCPANGKMPDLSKINVDSDGSRAVLFGIDKTPLESIRNLCSNVSEWTAPLLGTDARAVGASFDETRAACFFNKVVRIAAVERRPSIGFRCAIDADRMDAAYDGKDDRIEVQRNEE